MKKFIRPIVFGLLGLILIYLGYQFVQNKIEERKHREYVAGLKHTASPSVQILEDFVHVDYLNKKRTVRLYLPPGYDQDSSQTYPVIYFLDGQSLYDEKVMEGNEWQVDEHIDSLVSAGGPGAIVVGIDNADDRRTEYKPFLSPHVPKEKSVTGDKHAAFIVNELKPLIDEKFRTKSEASHTTIGGCSLGGLMAYYMIMTYPETFGNAIVFSPSFWVSEKVWELHKNVKNFSNLRIYINIGSLEGGDQIPNAEKAYKLLLGKGMTTDNLRYDIVEDEGHWHMTWRKGFKTVYPWILGKG